MKETYYFYGDQLTAIQEIQINNTPYVVCEQEENYYVVHRKSDLKKWEDTYQYQQQQKIKDQTEKLIAEQDIIANKIRQKALEQLTFSLKLNSAFSKDNKINQVGMAFANELQKILDKEKVTSN